MPNVIAPTASPCLSATYVSSITAFKHLIEVRGADRAVPIVGAHAPAAVDEQHDALIALVLELADDRLALPQRRPPVDVAHRIADAVLGQLLEVGALAALLVGLDADFLQAAIAGQPGVARDLREVGIDAARLVGAEPLEQLAQSPARADAHVRRRERHLAAPRRGHRVGGLDALPAASDSRDRQAFA